MNEKQQENGMQTRILYIFTRTPLHVGAGSSVGAIDQPIIRERHTGFPIIPASSLKGTFADSWNGDLKDENGKKVRGDSDVTWLFGSDDANKPCAGALQFSEAKLLAFPIRSAKGSFAWITCPLMLQRATRDGVIDASLLENLAEPNDEEAIFDSGKDSKLALDANLVLEEYTFKAKNWMELPKLSEQIATLLPGDELWKEVSNRLVILSNGMMSYFAHNACEVAQHVRIDDKTGTAAGTALFNQENVPGESLFYAMVNGLPGRGQAFNDRKPKQAFDAFAGKIAEARNTFQFGGDASTGLGYCTVKLN